MVSGVRVVRRKLFNEPEARAAMVERIKQARTGANYPLIQGELDGEVKAELRARRASRKTRFLDAGAGLGRGVLDALKLGVDAYGLAPHPPMARWLAGGRMAESFRRAYLGRLRGKWVDAPFESVVMPGEFDVIQSRFGLLHASNHALALENLLNSLKPGGALLFRGIDYGGSSRSFRNVLNEQVQAYDELLARGADSAELEALEQRHPELEWRRVAAVLERQGFSVPNLVRGRTDSIVPLRIRIVRFGRGKADLSAFYGHLNNRVPIRRASPKG